MRNNIVRAVALALCVIAFGGCTKVSPGWVGIKVNNYGDQKGVNDFPLRTGRVWFNPLTTDVYKFPTFMQTAVWTSSKTEGSPNDDSISFSDQHGVNISADIALSYRIDRLKVPSIFVTYRQSADALTHGYMRNKVREAFNDVGSQFPAIGIVGDQKAEFQAAVKEFLNSTLGGEGISFDTVAMVGHPRLEKQVQTAINAALQATQDAIKAQNIVAERQAIARQKIADAEGEAKSITLRAEAEAEANRIVAASITPELVQYEAIKKWDGGLPLVTGGSVPLIDISKIASVASSRPRTPARPANNSKEETELPPGHPLRKAEKAPL